jgi:hypothetical protein
MQAFCAFSMLRIAGTAAAQTRTLNLLQQKDEPISVQHLQRHTFGQSPSSQKHPRIMSRTRASEATRLQDEDERVEAGPDGDVARRGAVDSH